MTKLASLYERLEKATGPDRVLDCDIRLALLGDVAYGHQGPWKAPRPGTLSGYVETFREVIDHDDVIPDDVAARYTASIDAVVWLINQKLPGWVWRVMSCSVSDDAFVHPDFNHPVHGERLRAEWPEECQRDPLAYLGTDIDRRPPGTPAIALLLALFTALRRMEA